MRSVETELARLRNGDYIGWLGWLALERSGDPRVLAGIIQRLRRPAVPSWGTACSLAVHLDRFQAATPAQTELWSPDVVRELLGAIRFWLAQPLIMDNDHTWRREVLNRLRSLALAAQDVALAPAREALGEPPGPALTNLLLDGTVWGDPPVWGAKGLACAILQQSGEPADVPALRAVALDPAEDAWTRLAAATAWQRFAGPAVVAEGAALWLDPELEQASWSRTYAAELARLGPDLVPCALARLTAPDYTRRARAVYLLEALGQPAAQPLAELLRTTDDWRVVENATQALHTIDPALAKLAHRQREADGRSLSLAHPEIDADRGLSAAEQRR